MNVGLHYNLKLPEELSSIIEKNFWMLEDIGPDMLTSLREPVRFEAMTWIMLWSGKCKAEISLVNYDIEGPSLIICQSSQIMQIKEFSDDFKASFMVFSKTFTENLFLFFNSSPLYILQSRHRVVRIPDEIVPDFRNLYRDLNKIMAEKQNPYMVQAILFNIVSFIYGTAYKCYEPYQNEAISQQGRISNRFLALVQENYRKERFLEFYATQMDITSKHLSRTVKNETGYTAVEWIERYVILEAKLLLRSSTLNIQQISDELNFPSQSFFGKYFKKITGMSPKEFRNHEGQ